MRMAKLSAHLDKLGVAGSAFASLCCLGTPALLSLLSAIGLGFLIHDAILLPLMVVFLALSVIGLSRSCARHRKPYPLALGILSAIGLLIGVLFLSQTALPYVSLAGLIGASGWDIVTKRSCAVA